MKSMNTSVLSLRSLFVAILAGSAFAACNPYDPSLGEAPFRCGMEAPKCPDGYTCTADNICRRQGGGDGPDAGQTTCTEDSLEPNNSSANPTQTNVGGVGGNKKFSLVGLTICPADTDKDFFVFLVDVTNTDIQASISFNGAAGQLDIDLLNSAGQVIKQGEQIDANTRKIFMQNAAAGKHFIRVDGFPGVSNSYGFDLEIFPP